MLVGYSSSSEEENEAVTEAIDNGKGPAQEDGTDNCSARKKTKMESKVPKIRCVIYLVVIFL